MNKTLATINERIASYQFVNPAIPLHDKMYFVMQPGDALDIGLYKSNNDYRSAVCDRVNTLAGSPDDMETLDSWIYEGDYSGGAVTLEALAGDWMSTLADWAESDSE